MENGLEMIAEVEVLAETERSQKKARSSYATELSGLNLSKRNVYLRSLDMEKMLF